MQKLNVSSHTAFLQERLLAYLPPDSFAYRVKNLITTQYNLIFAEVEPEIALGYGFRYHVLFPAIYLFEWIMAGGGLETEDLMDETGRIFDDDGTLIPDALVHPISSAAQWRLMDFG